jgi:hypothetical protein
MAITTITHVHYSMFIGTVIYSLLSFYRVGVIYSLLSFYRYIACEQIVAIMQNNTTK